MRGNGRGRRARKVANEGSLGDVRRKIANVAIYESPSGNESGKKAELIFPVEQTVSTTVKTKCLSYREAMVPFATG